MGKSTDFELESTLFELDGNDVILGEDVAPITMPRFKHSNTNLSETKMVSDAFKQAALITLSALAFLCLMMLVVYGCLRDHQCIKGAKTVEIFNGEIEKIAERSDPSDDETESEDSDDDERGILHN